MRLKRVVAGDAHALTWRGPSRRSLGVAARAAARGSRFRAALARLWPSSRDPALLRTGRARCSPTLPSPAVDYLCLGSARLVLVWGFVARGWQPFMCRTRRVLSLLSGILADLLAAYGRDGLRWPVRASPTLLPGAVPVPWPLFTCEIWLSGQSMACIWVFRPWALEHNFFEAGRAFLHWRGVVGVYEEPRHMRPGVGQPWAQPQSSRSPSPHRCPRYMLPSTAFLCVLARSRSIGSQRRARSFSCKCARRFSCLDTRAFRYVQVLSRWAPPQSCMKPNHQGDKTAPAGQPTTASAPA